MFTTLQVFSQLNILSLCTSHTRMLTLIDQLGQDYDRKVTDWKRNVEDSTLNGMDEESVCLMSGP